MADSKGSVNCSQAAWEAGRKRLAYLISLGAAATSEQRRERDQLRRWLKREEYRARSAPRPERSFLNSHNPKLVKGSARAASEVTTFLHPELFADS